MLELDGQANPFKVVGNTLGIKLLGPSVSTDAGFARSSGPI